MQNFIILSLSILLWGSLPWIQSEEEKWSVQLHTAKDVYYLNELERQVIHELNKVRSNPKRYAEEYMEELRAFFEGKVYTYPGRTPINSAEGIFPLNECIGILKKTDPMPILEPAEGLAKAANLLTEEQQKHGGIGHISRNGSTPQSRMERFGDWYNCSAEDITYGSFEARQIVITLLIDDGVPSRGHRQNILSPCFRFAGVSFNGHPTYHSMCVIDYAGDYTTK
jgi:hypothetical protein